MITLNVNGLQSKSRDIQKERKKQESVMCCLQEDTLDSETNTLNLKRREKICHKNSNRKRVEVAIWIAVKIDVKAKNYHRQREMF